MKKRNSKWRVLASVALLTGLGGFGSLAASAGAAPVATSASIGFNPNLRGTVTGTPIRTNPAEEIVRFVAHGTAAPLGDFNYASNLIVHFGVDGYPLSITDGLGSFTGASSANRGDAIFFTLSGIFQPANNGTFDAVFIVTGGSGRFSGVIGSGRIAASAQLPSGMFVGAWDGTVKNPTR